MKQISKLFLLLLALLLPAIAHAHDFEVDGIYYLKKGNEASVTYRGTSSNQYSDEYTGEVEIPKTVTYNGTTYSVTSIGNSAFYGCTSLASVTIPNSVTNIGSSAFSGCSGLTNVTIPNSVTMIGISAFSGCTELTRVIIGNTVSSIGSSVFSNCNSLTSITVVSGNPTFDSRGNCNAIIETATNTLVAGCKNTIIPNSVTSIGNSAFFWCSGLTNVTIPNSVTTIGNSAFCWCSGLTNVTIPNSVTNIGSSAFSGCSGLTNVTIPNSVTTIGDGAFSSCSSLTDITFPNSISYIGSDVFSNTPWYDNQPDGVVYIGLIAYKYKGTMSENTTITIKEGTLCIAGRAFYNCEGLSSVVIPNTIISIGSYAFYCCINLTSVMIPDSVSIIGDYAFAGCSGLTNITIPNSVSSIGEYAFYGCSNLSDLTIDNSVSSIAEHAFENCFRLTRINITDLEAWCNNNLALFFYIEWDWLQQHNYHLYLNDIEVCDLVIPTSVTSISDFAFFNCGSLTSVEIPNSVTSIGNSAFNNCQNLTKVSIPSSVSEIGGFAFYNCKNLTDAFCYINNPSQIIIPPFQGNLWDGNGIWGLEEEIDISKRTLHVPSGSLEAYQSYYNWRELFDSIVEMDNHFEMPDTSVLYWETVTIPIVLSNDRNMLAFQTDIVLPEGFSIVTDEEDEYLIAPSNRLSSDHILMASDYGNGVVRVVCYTPESQPIYGYTGDLFYITVKVPEEAAGDYPIILRNSRLTTEDYTELRIPDASAVVNVKTYIPGDANNSRSVTVTDIVVTAQYVLGRNPQPFIFGAADMNGDGDVTVTDIMLIAYMLQHPSLNAPLRAPVLTANNDRMSADAISLMPGETRTVNIMLDNDLDYCAFQLDLTLPEGLTVSNFALTDRACGHAFEVCKMDDGKLRALCYSPTLATINGHEGALLTFDVTAMTHVTGDILVDAIELVTNTCQTVDMGAFNIQVNNSSAVNEVVSSKTVARVEYYNVAGQQIAEPISGITIIVTTYTDGTRSTNKILR